MRIPDFLLSLYNRWRMGASLPPTCISRDHGAGSPPRTCFRETAVPARCRRFTCAGSQCLGRSRTVRFRVNACTPNISAETPE
jgi:hypothetical protein